MSRYIDADVLQENLRQVLWEFYLGQREIPNWNEAVSLIGSTPSIDIVRCKECKWINRFGCHNPIWGDGWANYPSPSPREDGFCSYGEREGE